MRVIVPGEAPGAIDLRGLAAKTHRDGRTPVLFRLAWMRHARGLRELGCCRATAWHDDAHAESPLARPRCTSPWRRVLHSRRLVVATAGACTCRRQPLRSQGVQLWSGRWKSVRLRRGVRGCAGCVERLVPSGCCAPWWAGTAALLFAVGFVGVGVWARRRTPRSGRSSSPTSPQAG
jgi:hypothetical protein